MRNPFKIWQTYLFTIFGYSAFYTIFRAMDIMNNVIPINPSLYYGFYSVLGGILGFLVAWIIFSKSASSKEKTK